MIPLFKFISLFGFLILSSAKLHAEHLIWVSHEANSVIQMEVESAARKFGYTIVKATKSEPLGSSTAWTQLKISDFNRDYFHFLNYLFEVQDVHGVSPVSDKPGSLMRLILAGDMSETDFEKLSLEFLSQNIFIHKFHKFFTANLEIYIQPEQIPAFVEEMKKRNIFDSYSVDQQLYYFEDTEETKNRTGILRIPEFLNPDFIIKKLRQKFNFEEIDRTIEENSFIVRIEFKNATRKEAEALSHYFLLSAFEDQSQKNYLSEVQYQADEKRYAPEANIGSSRTRYLYTLVPKNAYHLLNSRGQNSYLRTLQVKALKLKERGYRVLSISADHENVGILFEAEKRSLNLKQLIKLGDILTFAPSGHPIPVTACEVYFR